MSSQVPAQTPTLVFDWGDTLMKVFPNASGPMADWPEVAEVDGIVEALEGLKDRYPMIIATGAADSGAELVWKALRRVGLAEYFKAVFTAKEVGFRKGELAYYRQIESMMSRPSHEMIMIGDSFRADVVAPKQAGWRAIWYAPAGQAAPGLTPLQDGEVWDLRSLPHLISQPMLPDQFTVLNWLIERETPFNILSHIQLVAATAYQLAIWLKAQGIPMDPLLTQRGAMLHDLAKIDSIKRRKERGEHGDHARMARDFLLQRHQPELAEIADRHMPVSDPTNPRRPNTWEQKVVHYADKLAEGTALVPPEERFKALRLRYPDFVDELEASQPILLEMQAEICAALHLSPEGLFENLRKSITGF